MKKVIKTLLQVAACAQTGRWHPTILLCFAFLLFNVAPAFSQTNTKVTVAGIVKDSTNTPVPNATVMEKGTKNAVSTNMDGAFTLNVSSTTAVLVISSVGFLTQEIPVGSQAYFSISLQKAPLDMGEVVVIGYGTQKKGSLIGAVTSVTAKDIGQVHGGATVSSSLAGKLS